MPAITFPFNYERHVYLEDGTRALIPRGTPMTVRPTILFDAHRARRDHEIYIPVGDGGSKLDRAAYGHSYDDPELIKLDHFIHDSSAGPLNFSSLMEPDTCWNLLFRNHAWDYISEITDESQDLFIEDIRCYQDGREYRPVIINAMARFMYQTAVVREKHLNVWMRMQTLFRDGNRNQEPSMIVEILNFRPEMIYGELRHDDTKVYFRCSVWDLFLRHHCPAWSEGAGGEILMGYSDTSIPDATTPVFFKKAAPVA